MKNILEYIRILVDTICAPLLADRLKQNFFKSFYIKGKSVVAFRDTEKDLCVNNTNFHSCDDSIYPTEFKYKTL